ncbi:lipoate--protein ligase family protein [Ectothiorhodospiraceae bacterium 2226]|nr:lipoate--protein ligase family protein [Ectothiorhodospiraceae bacterium 2226]
MSRQARWLDLGELDAAALHGAYAGLAEAQAPDAPPLLVWARCREPHLCLGASQGLSAEIDAQACRAEQVPVLRRPLGGGTVWVDHDQCCVFMIWPKHVAPARHGELFERALAPMRAVFHAYGLAAERVGVSDLWLGERKLLGSGAATLGGSMVFGSSFLLDFPVARFARLMRAPSETYRAWLAEELARGMTTWSAHAPAPAASDLAQCLRTEVERALGWTSVSDQPTAAERIAMQEAAAEAVEDLEQGAALVENGIKINHHSYLIETRDAAGALRLVLRHGRIARLACEPRAAEVERAALACVPEHERLVAAMASLGAAADGWARRIAGAAAGVRRVYG